jgi:ERCC4-related helicase
MVGAVFTRTAVLMSLLHGRGLLLTHGYESFGEYISNFFDLTTKDKKNVNFIKSLKETDVYKEFATYLDESRSTKNHPKLRKLVEILVNFFKDPKHAKESKVIVFS